MYIGLASGGASTLVWLGDSDEELAWKETLHLATGKKPCLSHVACNI
jgi:hypothetical protein